MDAITMLKNDHQTVEKLFKRFEDAGDRAYAEKRKIVDRIIEELSVHAAVEEQLFYPVTRATVPAVEDTALESLEEHHIVKWVLSELDAMSPEDERFDAKVTVLIENVRHHVEEEESEYFPEVRSELGRRALGELGDAMESARSVAPTHPHPRQPDTPPANLVVGTVGGVMDRVGDTVSGIAQGYVAAVQDVIDRVRGTKSRRPAPTGSRTARKTAASVRSGADDMVDRVISAVDSARDTVKDTGETAASGARETARSTTSGARQTGRTAASGARDTARKTTASAKKTGRAAAAGTRRTARKTARTAKSGAKKTAAKATSNSK